MGGSVFWAYIWRVDGLKLVLELNKNLTTLTWRT